MFLLKLYLQPAQPQISSGLRMRSSNGRRWSVISRCSREWEGSRPMMCEGRGPRWVIRNM